jgi:fructose-bisphosphate aldolase, class I
MNTTSMARTAAELVVAGKSILAADESGPTIEKRFRAHGIVSTVESRRAYRELLFTTDKLSETISGVILFDETIRQQGEGGGSMVDLLVQRGMIPGIKVDAGAKPLAGFPEEKVTEGLDGLRDRLAEYVGLGARFTKWRAVLTPGAQRPTQTAMAANAQALA